VTVEPSRGAQGGFVDLAITQRCNQRCVFCYEEKRGGPGEFTLEQVKELIREAARTHDNLVLCGKEALLRPDILEVVAYGARLGKNVVAFTNGQALARPGFVDALVEAGLGGVTISYHFPDPDTFAIGARVRAQMFARVLKGMNRVRDYNRAHPEAQLSANVETDLFVLNQGRLAEMRATLQENLRESFHSYTLGGMTPVQVFELDAEQICEPFEARRAELADFVRTNPPELRLRFTKTPLCLIPGHEHLSLDVQYAMAQAPIRHNLYVAAEVGSDDETLGASYDFDAAFQRNPYRWVCRSCRLVRICRFRRTAWYAPKFLPTREQKPLPVYDRGPADVLAALTTLEPSFVDRPVDLERLSAPVEPPTREERLLAPLQEPGDDGVRVVDAWLDGKPFLTTLLTDGEARASLLLTGPTADSQPLAFVIGSLDVVPTPLTPGAAGLVRKALARLARAPLPTLADWEGEHGFRRQRAAVLQAAWQRLGSRLWPGEELGAGWRTRSAHLVRSTIALKAELAGAPPVLVSYTVTFDGEGTEPAREVITVRGAGATPADAQLPPGVTRELERGLTALFAGSRVSTGQSQAARQRGVSFLLVAEPASA